jgi:thioredoxin reductase (NADPH)
MAEVKNAVIVGAGPAGMAAAIYLQRVGLAPLVLERDTPGGLLRNANLVENYPGFTRGIEGEELAAQFVEQMKNLSIEVKRSSAKKVKLTGNIFKTETESIEISSHAVIIASGTRPKVPRIPGVEGLQGKKVFSDIVSMHIPENKEYHYLVLGGGDAAFDYALNLCRRGHRATIVVRSRPQCIALLRERAAANGIVVREGILVEQVEETVQGVVMRCRTGPRRLRLYGDAIVIAYGRSPELGMLDSSLLGRVKNVESPPATEVPGLYLAGDVARGRNRQTGIAVGDGIMAAMLLEQFVKSRRRKG